MARWIDASATQKLGRGRRASSIAMRPDGNWAARNRPDLVVAERQRTAQRPDAGRPWRRIVVLGDPANDVAVDRTSCESCENAPPTTD
jgi:hypothetical protein